MVFSIFHLRSEELCVSLCGIRAKMNLQFTLPRLETPGDRVLPGELTSYSWTSGDSAKCFPGQVPHVIKLLTSAIFLV